MHIAASDACTRARHQRSRDKSRSHPRIQDQCMYSGHHLRTWPLWSSSNKDSEARLCSLHAASGHVALQGPPLNLKRYSPSEFTTTTERFPSLENKVLDKNDKITQSVGGWQYKYEWRSPEPQPGPLSSSPSHRSLTDRTTGTPAT